MSYLLAMGECFFCKRIFTFNPERVPSVRVKDGKPDPAGAREPLCSNCVERANEVRKAHGLEPIRILPGAYEAEEVGI